MLKTLACRGLRVGPSKVFPCFLFFFFKKTKEKKDGVIEGVWVVKGDSKVAFRGQLESDSKMAQQVTFVNCGPRGGTGGAKPSSGVQRFWGPLRASGFDPSFQ